VKTQKIIIADNNKTFREGFKRILLNIGHVEIVSEVENGAELLKILESGNVDIVFTDINMPELNGIEATKLAHQKYPGLRIIAFTSLENKRYISQMVDAGANGYLSKGKDNYDIFRQILEEASSGFFISPELVTNSESKLMVN
jgi:DNA-binding NarL/FixJ family response regulator